jgi:gentisate 1,2-dioxygenase
MTDSQARFADAALSRTPQNDIWEPVIISGAQIQQEADRLAALKIDDPIDRQSRIVHPHADSRGLGLAPGIEVRLSVLKPGERARPFRHNATDVGFAIAGRGRVQIGERKFDVGQYDVWNNPAWTDTTIENPFDQPLVRLTYSNAALLRLLNVYLIDEKPSHPGDKAAVHAEAEHQENMRAPQDLFRMSRGDEWLMSYERLINPPAVESATHHWRWKDVKEELDKLTALGEKYHGRRLYLLYNPMTGRTNGTTPSFFATMTVRPPKIIDRPHRHVSAAINYYFSGAGYSRVAGKHYEWRAGDLMLSAPGWAIHNHASHDQGPVYELTVQDQPFHISQESLLWQESLAAPPHLLGAQPGFTTNRAEAQTA